MADRCPVCGTGRSSKTGAAWIKCDRGDGADGNVAGVRGKANYLTRIVQGLQEFRNWSMIKSYQLIWKRRLMNKIEKRTFSLPVEHADFIDEKVNSGSYASASEVVRAGLRALQERDAAIERWLNEEVAEAYDAMKVDPARGVLAEEVFAELSKRSARKLKDIEDDKQLVDIINLRAAEVGVPVNIDDL